MKALVTILIFVLLLIACGWVFNNTPALKSTIKHFRCETCQGEGACTICGGSGNGIFYGNCAACEGGGECLACGGVGYRVSNE